MASLTSSLGIMKGYLSRSDPVTNVLNEGREALPKPPLHDFPSFLPASQCMEDLQSPHCFIFNRCILVNVGEQTAGECPEFTDNLPLYAGCIVLNLALLHHRIGVKSGGGDRFSLLKAAKMYCMTLEIVHALSLSSPSSSSGRHTALSMRLVALNNLAALNIDCRPGAVLTLVTNQVHVALEEVKTIDDVLLGRFFSDTDTRQFTANVEIWEATGIAALAA